MQMDRVSEMLRFTELKPAENTASQLVLKMLTEVNLFPLLKPAFFWLVAACKQVNVKSVWGFWA